MKKAVKIYKTHVQTKLLIRQIVFGLLAMGIVIQSSFNVFSGKIHILLALFGFVLALTVGLLLSRTMNVLWHQDKAKVISQLDILGLGVLGIYLFMEINRTWIFKNWIHGATLNSFSLVLVGGLLTGRFLGTDLRIHKAFYAKKEL